MYIRWPQKPFLMPPATANVALAFGLVGETIQPPPVTKSAGAVSQEGNGGGEAGHEMSACACEMTMSASGGPPGVGLLATTCRALTSMLADCPAADPDCSLITTEPALSGSWSV